MIPAGETGSGSRRRLDALLAAPAAPLPWTPVAGEPVVVYGGGNTGRELLGLLASRGVPVLGVVDRRGAELEASLGVRCVAPDAELLDATGRERTPILLAVHNRDTDVGAIAAHLRQHGWGRVVSFPLVHAALEAALGERFWLGSRRVYADCAPEVVAGHDRLADDASRAVYVRTLEWRLTGDPSHAPVPRRSVQYFPEDVPRSGHALRFVDAGAFDGDSLRAAFGTREGVEEAWAFEPDPANFRMLAITARELADRHGVPVACWPCGVWSESDVLRFSAGLGEASRLDVGGSLSVTCVSLDDALAGERPTMVKLDIEGAEPAALRGAPRTIEHDRPRLAVCAYHRPEHLWSLGQQIEHFDTDYDLYLRAHAYSGFDLVLYAVPR